MKAATGEEIALAAMKKEFNRLSRLVDKAKAETDENMTVGAELIAIHEEFAEVVRSKSYGPNTLKKVEQLEARQSRARKILKKSLVELLDKQLAAESKRDALGAQIQMHEFRLDYRTKSRQPT